MLSRYQTVYLGLKRKLYLAACSLNCRSFIMRNGKQKIRMVREIITWLAGRGLGSRLHKDTRSHGSQVNTVKEAEIWPFHKMTTKIDIPIGSNICLIALYSPNGEYTILHERLISVYESLGYIVITIMAVDTLLTVKPKSCTARDNLFVIENKYFDFASWATAMARLPTLAQCNEVLLTNDSVVTRELSLGQLAQALTKMRELELDVCFMTGSNEIKRHGQTYFMHLSNSAIRNGALDFFKRQRFWETKEDLIRYVELDLMSELIQESFSVGELYPPDSWENPTLQGWEGLCRRGYPFVKVSAYSFGSSLVSKEAMRQLVDPRVEAIIKDHLRVRNLKYGNASISQWHKHCLNSIGATVSPRVNPVTVDIDCPESLSEKVISTIPIFTCILHAFYTDIAYEIIAGLSALNTPFRLIITVDTEEKRLAIHNYCSKHSIEAEVYIYENRGRDILPMLKVAVDAKIKDIPVLHLHTKRSPHNPKLREWGSTCFSCLAGSRIRVLSSVKLIAETNIGLIYPEFPQEIEGQINWGYNYNSACYIAKMLGISIDRDDFLAFPAGSMMWLHPNILLRLASCHWKVDDFENENGLLDGTMAHAVERIFLHTAISLNKEYLQVPPARKRTGCSSDNSHVPVKNYIFTTLQELYDWARGYVSPRLKASLKSAISSNKKITYEVDAVFDSTEEYHLNIVVPTIEPEKIYGGISTALHVAKRVYSKRKFCGIRVIVTSDGTTAQGVSKLSEFFGIEFSFCSASTPLDSSLPLVCNLYRESDRIIRISANDIFMATAWWTASIARTLIQKQNNHFHTDHSLIYLIQDYECGFYAWGDNYLLARNTYCSNKTLAIINSVPLYNYITQRHSFNKSYLLPYLLNPVLKARLDRLPKELNGFKENIILCYGRPSTARNCFGILRDALVMWRKVSVVQENWKIIVVGEEFDHHHISEIPGAICHGKLELEDYADYLIKAKIGISLMCSPHPSYPPLEMASFGVKVITNDYDTKDLSRQNPNVFSLSEVSPATISTMLDTLCGKTDFISWEYVEDLPLSALIFPEDFSFEE